MAFLDDVVLPKGSTPTLPSNQPGGGFLSSVVLPSSAYHPPTPAPAPAAQPSFFSKVESGIGNFVSSLISGPAERANAVIESIKQGSLEPLKRSLSTQLSAKDEVGLPAVLDQLASGFAGGHGATELAALHPESPIAASINPTDSRIPPPEPVKLPVRSETPNESAVPVSTPTTRHADYAASQGYEPYKAPDQLPTIDLGKPAKSDLPTIQTEPPLRKTGDLNIEPIKPSVAPQEPATASQVPKTAETTPKPSEAPVKAPAAPAPQPLKTEPGVSKIGKSIEAKAVEAKLTQGFKDTAGFDPITIKDQAERATKLINETPDQAREVIRGDKPLPSGLKGTAVITAMEEHIKQLKDTNKAAELAYELANSPLVSATSEAAQEMRLAAERVPDSITAKFQEIKAAREAALEKRGGTKKAVKKVTDEIQTEIRKASSPRPTWDEFIKDLTCRV